MSLDWIAAELAAWDNAGLRRARRVTRPLAAGMIEVNGRPLLNLAANDYLCLAGDARLAAAAREAIAEAGIGSRASALVSGRTVWHAELERRLAAFEHAEAAVLFPTGYAANVGTITALVDREDSVFCDRLNHASLIDGCRLSGARWHVIPHLDLGALEVELEKARGRRRRLIVIDSVFSMDGDVADLPALVELAERFDAMLLIDEAHATGVLGPGGRGLAEHFGATSSRLVRVGTLSKALGCLGGFVVGSQTLIDWLWNKARPQIFSTALPPAVAAAGCAALEVVEQEPERRSRLRTLSETLRARLTDAGLAVPETSLPTPIVPVVLGDEGRTLAAAARLEQAGFLVAAIRPPTVPAGSSRLRISLHCDVTDEQLDRLAGLLAAFASPQAAT
ncbi:8-amino-7-oxononanoate synthase 2 [Caulifigura coniformis]|uniref:8-amino-7-ketopelargonate synthase n=1 Tax=Caulifigura coniformis TaxID=2527983 RepID=A0A517S8L2_9PLAN|nr:8-amino-7-oxononanoate synthase [Caulifigura coniformis]QDT52466.1 8-amino-7-oxononanoate synthase 2 [Caulifigura coniformis]